MTDLVRNSLFYQDRQRFEELSLEAIQFNSVYNGNNIIQDDIFSILSNYARRNERQMELFRFPTRDDAFCALTCVKRGWLFAYVNSALPLSKQIFAAAHELYHIWCFLSERDGSVLRKGSLLDAGPLEQIVKSNEDREANAFAGLLLVPSAVLWEQMKVYGISATNPTLEDVIRLMAIFAVPYKAILLRLYEEGYMNVETVETFLQIPQEILQRKIGYEHDAARWQRRTPEIVQMGRLQQWMEYNQEYELLPKERENKDKGILDGIVSRYVESNG